MIDAGGLRGEDRLNYLFAETVPASPEFRSWLLRKTKFKRLSATAELLAESEYLLRPRQFWWRHLHIENKILNSKFTQMQAECYEARGLHMMIQREFLNYNDFETVLLCPRWFRTKRK